MIENLLFLIIACVPFNDGKIYKLPKNFTIGAATAAYQVEGGWNLDGKSINIWDNITHIKPGFINDHSNGDVACDSYHKWREDIKLLKYLGATHYRFSIAWTRILPTGYTNAINPAGIRYYNNIINELLKNGIEPLVTMYHFDLPQSLQDLGGLASDRITTYFQDYAKILFENFGDRVKKWITFNEPLTYCGLGYAGRFAPAVYAPGIGAYICGKNLLVSHGKIYRLYEKFFKASQQGEIGITIIGFWFQPKSNSSEEVEAQNRAIEITFGWWMNPIFSKEGNYPDVMINRIAYESKIQNFSESRLPAFTENEIQLIKGSYDFLGLNYYTGYQVEPYLTTPTNPPSITQDLGVKTEKIPTAESTAVSVIDVYPEGLREILNYIKKKYDNPPTIITENGFPDKGSIYDPKRVDFLKRHLIEIVKAINEGCKVTGYTYWALMDNFEWTSGYSIKYGLMHVDFNNPNRTRVPKLSAQYFRNITKYRFIDSES